MNLSLWLFMSVDDIYDLLYKRQFYLNSWPHSAISKNCDKYWNQSSSAVPSSAAPTPSSTSSKENVEATRRKSRRSRTSFFPSRRCCRATAALSKNWRKTESHSWTPSSRTAVKRWTRKLTATSNWTARSTTWLRSSSPRECCGDWMLEW